MNYFRKRKKSTLIASLALAVAMQETNILLLRPPFLHWSMHKRTGEFNAQNKAAEQTKLCGGCRRQSEKI